MREKRAGEREGSLIIHIRNETRTGEDKLELARDDGEEEEEAVGKKER